MQGIVWGECNVPGEFREMQRNARETHGSGCKVPEKCRGRQGNVSECVQSARGMQGNTGECQENI